MTRPFRHVMLAIAFSAAIGPCAAQDRTQDKTSLLVDDVLRVFGTDSYLHVFATRFILSSAAAVVRDGETTAALELICDGRYMELRDRSARTTELYPVPEGFCETLMQALARRSAGGPQ